MRLRHLVQMQYEMPCCMDAISVDIHIRPHCCKYILLRSLCGHTYIRTRQDMLENQGYACIVYVGWAARIRVIKQGRNMEFITAGMKASRDISGVQVLGDRCRKIAKTVLHG